MVRNSSKTTHYGPHYGNGAQSHNFLNPLISTPFFMPILFQTRQFKKLMNSDSAGKFEVGTKTKILSNIKLPLYFFIPDSDDFEEETSGSL